MKKHKGNIKKYMKGNITGIQMKYKGNKLNTFKNNYFGKTLEIIYN